MPESEGRSGEVSGEAISNGNVAASTQATSQSTPTTSVVGTISRTDHGENHQRDKEVSLLLLKKSFI